MIEMTSEAVPSAETCATAIAIQKRAAFAISGFEALILTAA